MPTTVNQSTRFTRPGIVYFSSSRSNRAGRHCLKISKGPVRIANFQLKISMLPAQVCPRTAFGKNLDVDVEREK